jgi:hypothetical protein
VYCSVAGLAISDLLGEDIEEKRERGNNDEQSPSVFSRFTSALNRNLLSTFNKPNMEVYSYQPSLISLPVISSKLLLLDTFQHAPFHN